MITVYLVQHLHLLDEVEDIKIIGIYRSEAAAMMAINRVKNHPGFCDFPNVVDSAQEGDNQGFHICPYDLDSDHWTEGYVTL